MNLESMNSVVCRVFFGVAFLLLTAGVVEKAANVAGYTLIGGELAPSRVLQWAGLLLVFVIAVLLRQIRERLPGR